MTLYVIYKLWAVIPNIKSQIVVLKYNKNYQDLMASSVVKVPKVTKQFWKTCGQQWDITRLWYLRAKGNT